MAQEKVILDEDCGGDTLQALIVLLSRPQEISVRGLTVVFGNTGHKQALKNAGALLHFVRAESIPYFPGAQAPNGQTMLEGDGAHGNDGIGGVTLPPATVEPQTKNAVDFILGTLRNEPPKTVTIIAAAPQTNIAAAIAREPETTQRVKQILIMGGCTTSMPAKDIPARQGNITPYAEFNFYMAANDARSVMGSGLPITLFPMNCTHQMTLTPARAEAILAALPGNRDAAEKIIGVMSAPAEMDDRKFGIAPVMHDIHTALYMLYPDLYEGRRGFVAVTIAQGVDVNGRSDFHPDPAGPVLVVEKIKDPDALFSHFLNIVRDRFNAPP